MAKVLLVSAAPENDERFPFFARHDLERLLKSAREDVFGVHSLTNAPDEADIIMFVERAHATGAYMEYVRRHPLVKKYREKVFVFNSRYFGVPFLPGVYGCVRKRDFLFPRRLRSGHYLEVFEKDEFDFQPFEPPVPYLYSFVGSVQTWPRVRGRLAQLNHPRGYFADTSAVRKKLETESDLADKDAYTKNYLDIVKKSKFVLCPRGDAVSSMRLFESMKMGRAPVIIGDQWVFPEGPAWETFSVKIPEEDIQSIPSVLERLEDRAEEMGLLARQAWEDWFSEKVAFHRAVEWCLDIKRERKTPESIMRFPVYLGLLFPTHLRSYVRTRLLLFKKHGKIIL